MREALIQAFQVFLKRRYNKQIVEIQDPFRGMQRLLANMSIHNVIDGGGYHGEIALQLAALFPQAMVYSFEPSEMSFEQLTKKVRGNPRIKPVQCGLSSKNTTMTLFVNAQDSANSLSPAGEGGRKYQSWQTVNVGKEEISVVTLDEWAVENGVTSIDVVKLDLQGHELHALKGAERALSTTVKLVYSEVEFLRVYDQNCLHFEVESYLAPLGFELFQLYNLTSGDDNRLVCGDAIFFHRERVVC